MTLWTEQNLEAARRIYSAAGFCKVHEEPFTGIGRDLVSETWDLDLLAEQSRYDWLPRSSRRVITKS